MFRKMGISVANQPQKDSHRKARCEGGPFHSDGSPAWASPVGLASCGVAYHKRGEGADWCYTEVTLGRDTAVTASLVR